ncbi:MAG: GreA/GreB family elongation factor [Acidobacteriota bacterium]|nr:GreA/GreB family elongation factor [Acidobacteriota bacterium]
MAISKTTQNYIAKGDFDSIEDEWLAQSGRDPENLDYFIGVARALQGQGQADRARTLLELLDDQISDRGLWRLRLKMLRRARALIYDDEEMHRAILATLKEIHGDHSMYELMVDKLGLNKAIRDISKTWEKAERLESLMGFDVGTVVLMKGKGAGKIQEINLQLDTFKVDFPKHPGLMVGFRAAAKMLIALTEGHILRRKMDEPDQLKKLAKDDPPELLRLVLQSYNEERTAAQIKQDLTGVVTPKRWTSWWNAARKHPQVITETSGRASYRWAATSAHAFEAVWQSFESAPPREKVDLYKRNADRDEDLKQRMVRSLAAAGNGALMQEPGLALEIWLALERGGDLPDDLPWGAPDILSTDTAHKSIAEVQDRNLRERAAELVQEHREDWPKVFAHWLLQEEDPRLLDRLTESLGQEDPQELNRFLEQVLSQPRKHPAAFVWMAERAVENEELRQRNPLRFLKQLLISLQDDNFASYRAARLMPLFESGGTVPRLIPMLEEGQAEQAATAVDRAPGLEEYQRSALTSALELRFSSLRKETEAPLYATRDKIEEKRKEFQHLKSVELPANRKAIEEARAMGDLRENFEYKSARQRHEYLSARVAGLNHDLSRVQPIDLSFSESSEVRVGTRLKLKTDGGEERTLTILGPWESEPEKHIVSYESELAKALLGKKEGEEATAGGTTYTVESIEAVQESDL